MPKVEESAFSANHFLVTFKQIKFPIQKLVIFRKVKEIK